jgi:hypothetical protein
MKHHPDLRAAITRAGARARAGRRSPTVYDLFRALIETPGVHLMIHRAGGDADVLASELEAASSSVPAPSGLARMWPRAPDPSFGRVLAAAAHAPSRTAEDLGPVDVFAAGFDAGGAALLALLERSGLSRAAVRQWMSGDAVGEAEAAPAVPGRPRGFLAVLWGRLTWRVLPPDDASSSDGVIAACAMAALAVWLAYDRTAAGDAANWYPVGVAGLAWYAFGLLALAWVLHRVSGTRAGFRSVLAPIAGWVPLAVALSAALQWAPGPLRRPWVLLLALLGFAHVRRALASVGASRPRAAILTAAGFIAVFAWGTEAAWVRPRLWYPATSDDEADAWEGSERLLFEQPDRIDAAAARVPAGAPGRPNVYFVGFAGTGEEKVFAEETKLAERVISQRYGVAGRSLLLMNDRRDLETWPFASVHGLRRALGRLAERMDRSQDVLFLFLSSHGSETSLAVSNSNWPLDQLDPEALRQALDDSGIRWRVIVISACHSGAFLPALAGDETAVFTSAAADRTSFGCSDERDMTEFGEAFFRDAVPGAPSLAAAFDQAKGVLAAEERRRDLPESRPQANIGAAIAAHWQLIEARHPPAARGR